MKIESAISNMKKRESVTAFEDPWNYLREECAKLRAIAHLVESESFDAMPLDRDEIQWGIAEIMNISIEKIRQIARDLEESELKRASLHKTSKQFHS